MGRAIKSHCKRWETEVDNCHYFLKSNWWERGKENTSNDSLVSRQKKGLDDTVIYRNEANWVPQWFFPESKEKFLYMFLVVWKIKIHKWHSNNNYKNYGRIVNIKQFLKTCYWKLYAVWYISRIHWTFIANTDRMCENKPWFPLRSDAI